MKRVMVVGSPGGGKSTFARQLAEITGLPLIHLDFRYHNKKANYDHNKEQWFAYVREQVKAPRWIIDGNFSTTFPDRFEKADTVFFFNLPLHGRLHGVFQRRWQYRNKKRKDMPDTWEEKLDWQFLKHVLTFKAYTPKIIRLLESNHDKDIIVFKNRRQTREYLGALIQRNDSQS